ncbi:uncharacterized protein BX663DRAFT_529878 [Cokeromyces recurvatus]|uniref:uncharacterized protein n=1 Tax=Cokeromyces recurvatus TaxID=90255 RepID=UPI00221F8377|nr:uncharacterized protein BX663DRAFT_529878 [Cokeromyces recurvatus]KAI7904941.1 hypothetical protein BX663DRAFT_529878 [Cokeromyces recurvatus]
MIRFSEDVMIKPSYTAWFWIEIENRQLLPLQNQTLYQDDWLGLKSLDDNRRLELLVCPGKHEDPNACPETDYRIPIERFAQLISTHWHFDHLDSIKTKTYKIISEQFQKHISISIIESNSQSLQQKAFIQPSSSWDMMDLEILYAQIFGAIQAHTEGSLHLAWDRLADTLGQPALESHIKQIVSNYCGGLDHDALGAFCLKQNATQLSTDFYNYIESQLIEVFRTLDNNVLPQLLLDISKDLLDVLDYFNRLFSLNDNQQLYLQVTPWSHNDVFVKSKLMPLLEKSTLNDNHLSEFFSNYACLSRT